MEILSGLLGILGLIPMILFAVAFSFILIIGGIAVIAAGVVLLSIILPKSIKKHQNKYRQEYDKIKEDSEKKNTELNAAITELKENAVEFLEKNSHRIEFLPVDYQTADAAGFMLQAVKNLRADSLKEAINLYAEELKHRERMAAAERQRIQNEEMMYAMQMLNMNMENMTSSQERTNRTLNDINFIQTMDFLSRN